MTQRTTKTSFEVSLDLNKRKIRVLLVDNEVATLNTTKQVLEAEESFQIVTATSAKDAQQKMKRQSVDVVVSEYKLPKKNGLEFLQELRQAGNNMPFIIFTDKGNNDVATKALKLGATQFLNKNGEPKTVYSQLAHAIEQAVTHTKESHTSSMKNTEDHPTEFSCTVRDLTECKIAEQMLKESEERFKQLFCNMPTAAAVYEAVDNGEDFVFKDFNTTAEKTEHVQKETIIGKRVSEAFPGVKDLGLLQVLQRVWRTGQPEYLPESLYKDGRDPGSYRENWVYKLSNGEVVALYNDVSIREKTEEELRESDRKYRELIEALPEIIFEVNSQGRITSANGRIHEITGYTQEDTEKSLNMLDFVAPQDRQRAVEDFMELLTGKRNEIGEYMLQRKDGSSFPAMVKVILVTDKNKIVGVKGIIIDLTQLRRTENELNKSLKREKMLSEIIRSASLPIALGYPDGRICDPNDAYCRLTGYSREELEKIPYNDELTPPEWRDLTNTELQKVQQTKESVTYEQEYIRKDGSKVPIEISVHPRLDSNGNVDAFLAVITDLTERKKIRKELENIANLSHENPDPVIRVARNGNVLYANPAARRLLTENPLDRDQLAPERWCRQTEEALSTRQPSEFLEEHNGRTYTFRVTPISSEGYANLYATDITERKQIQEKLELYSQTLEETVWKRTEELQRSQQNLRSIIYGSPVPMFFLGADHRVIYWNKALESFSGIKADTVINSSQHWKAFYESETPCLVDFLLEGYGNNLPKWSTKYHKSELVEEGVGVIDFFNLPNGKKAWLSITAVVIKDSKKNIIGALETVQDITELKEIQEKLLKSERLAAIGQLAGMVGHDLRNPLMGIAGAEFYLKTSLEPNLDQKQRRVLKIIEEDVAYSDKIVQDLQDYAKEARLEKTPIDPKTLVAESLSLIKVPNNIQILDETNNKPTIKVDINQMKRAFSNIMKNAVEAMPQGGKLEIKTQETRNNIEFTFKDTGTGIPKDILDKIGKPLVTTKARGMGFGLAICFRKVEAHGGKISIESQVGKGTTIHVTLPIAPEPEKETKSTADAQPSPETAKTQDRGPKNNTQ